MSKKSKKYGNLPLNIYCNNNSYNSIFTKNGRWYNQIGHIEKS